MLPEHRQTLTDKLPIDCNFSPSFIEGDPINSVTFECPATIAEYASLRIVSGQTVQVRVDTTGGVVGNIYLIKVHATTIGGDIGTISFNVHIKKD